MFNAHLSLFWLFISTSVTKLYGMLEEGRKQGHDPSVQLRQPTSISFHDTIHSFRSFDGRRLQIPECAYKNDQADPRTSPTIN